MMASHNIFPNRLPKKWRHDSHVWRTDCANTPFFFVSRDGPHEFILQDPDLTVVGEQGVAVGEQGAAVGEQGAAVGEQGAGSAPASRKVSLQNEVP